GGFHVLRHLRSSGLEDRAERASLGSQKFLCADIGGAFPGRRRQFLPHERGVRALLVADSGRHPRRPYLYSYLGPLQRPSHHAYHEFRLAKLLAGRGFGRHDRRRRSGVFLADIWIASKSFSPDIDVVLMSTSHVSGHSFVGAASRTVVTAPDRPTVAKQGK